MYLFRFSSLKNDTLFSVQVQHLLESENVIKLGRAVKNDFKHLDNDFNISCRGDLDVLGLSVKKGAVAGRKNFSLDFLVNSVFGYRMDKYNDIRLSNWDSHQLTDRQIKYAALDAWVSLELYNTLKDLPAINVPIDFNDVYSQHDVPVSIYANKSCKGNPVAYGIAIISDNKASPCQELVLHNSKCDQNHPE